MIEWEHIGGGCRLTANLMYPCDDQYEHRKTGETVRIRSTQEAHFKMPTDVHTIAELYELDGVKPKAESDGG